jgi:branched-chain amino acid transport system permease protein/neutral amino acid transport system permease protein
MAMGACVTFAADAAGVPLIGAIVLGAINGGVVAVAADRIVFRNFADRNPVVLLVVSIGVAFILRNAIRIIWTADTRYYEVPIEAAPQFFGSRSCRSRSRLSC